MVPHTKQKCSLTKQVYKEDEVPSFTPGKRGGGGKTLAGQDLPSLPRNVTCCYNSW